MLPLTVAPVFILLIFGCQEVNSCGEPQCAVNEEESWSYGGRNGPSKWGTNYTLCNGDNQSAININTRNVVTDRQLILEKLNYDQPITSARVVNNGHTVQVYPTDKVERSIRIGSADTDTYVLSQFHFHWGNQSGCGSEHAIDGKFYDMELHLVHLNSNQEIAVLGVLLKVFRSNRALVPLVERLSSIQYKNQETGLTSELSLDNLLPKEQHCFFRYNGSLTTPPCSEGVKWTLFKNCATISRYQIREFYKLFSTSEGEESSCQLVNNYRPVQDTNNRQVAFQPGRKHG